MSKHVALAALVLLGGCATPRPDILSGSNPADPAIPSRLPTQPSVTAGNGVAFPVTAGDWGAVNRRVTPGSGRSP